MAWDTYDSGLEGVEANALRVRAGDVRGEEGDESGGREGCGLDGRLEDILACSCIVLSDSVM